jgi:hypothetical protein
MDFNWNLFGITLSDSKCLYNLLKNTASLKRLAIKRSDIDDLKLKMISAGIAANTTLQSLGKQRKYISCRCIT